MNKLYHDQDGLWTKDPEPLSKEEKIAVHEQIGQDIQNRRNKIEGENVRNLLRGILEAPMTKGEK